MKLARVLCSLSLAALVVIGPRARSQANVVENQTAILYVDAHSGSDANSGASSSPLKTIQAAVNKANINNQKSIGTRIIVDAGIYRETVSVNPVSGQTSAALTIQAATNGTAIIAASDLISAWSTDPQYSGAYVANWTPAQSTCALPSGWPALQPIALHTEMLFLNGIAMTQVLNYSDLKPGTFFVGSTDGTLHLWPPSGTEPSNATIEVASRAKTISIVGRSNIVLRGLVFEHAASCINTSGATVTSSSNVLVDSVQANWNNWGGLGISSSSNITVQNSMASYNGGVGFQGTRDQAALYTGNETDYNNWRGAEATLYNWASGGAKFFQMRTTSVQGHLSYNNQAQGLWFDTDNQNITINNATLVGSYNAALQLERNEGPVTLENSHLCSSGVGVNVLNTQELTVDNNVFYNNGATNKYQAQFYLAGTAGGISTTNWQTGQVYNLVTTGTTMSGNEFIDALPGQYVFGTYVSGTDWTDFTSTVKSSFNTWYDPGTPNAFRIANGKNVDLAGWQTATGADYNSTWAEPSASPASSCAPPSAAYPDFNVSVDSGSYTMTSGLATANVRVNSFNFGAVNLSVSGLPTGVTASFSNQSLTNGYSTLTLTASSTSTAQTVPVTLWAISGDRVHSATFNLTVTANPAVIGTSASLSSSASTITQGTPVTLSAAVKPASGTGAPTGSVTFYSGATPLGSATLSSGIASIATSALPVGTDSITAIYAGTTNFLASTSNVIPITVNSAAVSTTTTLASSSSALTQNGTVTLSATVKPASGAALPTGTVTFYSGTVSLGSATLSSGIASISTSALPVGTDSVTAAYSGAVSFKASSSNIVSVTVSLAAPTAVNTVTALTPSAISITQNSPLTLTAIVKQASGTIAPTGSVTFFSGSAVIGSAQLSAGSATITIASLPAGANSLTASYAGTSTFNRSTSAIVAVTVNAVAVKTSTMLTTSSTGITQNSAVTLTAAVKQASGNTTPTGSITFFNGSANIGTVMLTAGTATLTTSSLPAGLDSITATYAGASLFNPSNSNSVAITVNPLVAAPNPVPSPGALATRTALASSTPQADQGFTICLTATVATISGSAIPTGSVDFLMGKSKIGTAALANGNAYLTTDTLPPGNDAVTASYAGDSSFGGSSSNAVTVNIMGPDFEVKATPSSISASPGQSVDVALLITPKNGFDQIPSLDCSGLSAGSTCSFGTPAKQPDGTSVVQMTIHTAPLAAGSGNEIRSRAPFALALFPLLFWISSKQRRRLLKLLSASALFLAIVILGAGAIGCGGHTALNSSQTTSAQKTIVNVTVNAHSTNGVNHATTVTLTLM